MFDMPLALRNIPVIASTSEYYLITLIAMCKYYIIYVYNERQTVYWHGESNLDLWRDCIHQATAPIGADTDEWTIRKVLCKNVYEIPCDNQLNYTPLALQRPK